MATATAGDGVRIYGYSRVSTDGQADSGLGLGAQRERIAAEAGARGWQVDWVTDEGVSGSVPPEARDGLGTVLESIRPGDVLVVAKLDRLSRSLLDFAGLMERGRREGWALVALDLGVDTTTAAGEMVAGVMATFANYERRIIGQRTRDALDEKRRQGVRLGRPVTTDAQVRQRIAADHAAGESLSAIARRLTAEGVPTARGGVKWYPSTVRAVVRSVELDREVEAAHTPE